MKIGKYEIKGRLGRGGMGVVYKAAMPLTGKIVALKVCRPAEIMLDLMGADGVRELFLAEAMAMANIRHPNIATVLDVGEAEVPDDRFDREEDGGKRLIMPFFAMEYYCTDLGQVMGETYEAERPSRVIAPDDALEYTRQLLEALRRLHFSGLVHRDVKPFNVMLTDEDRVKLIDFGLSRLRNETAVAMNRATNRPQGMVVGSPYYTAPEQEADPDAADGRADLFSVGVTLFRMITGCLPVDEAGRARTASRTVSEMSRNRDWCPDQVWDEFLERAMHPEPGKRFQSAADMLAGLAELRDHWERARAEACAWVDDEAGDDTGGEEGANPPSSASIPVRPLRNVPLKVGQKDARRRMGLDGLWRPTNGLGQRPVPRLEKRGELVHDLASGLVWQASGSEYPLEYSQAEQYVENLRENRYQGRSGWRLPTVDELASLMVHGADDAQMCLPPLFAPDRQHLWSADAKAFTAAWYVNANKGFVWWQDKTCRFFVRAVCSEVDQDE